MKTNKKKSVLTFVTGNHLGPYFGPVWVLSAENSLPLGTQHWRESTAKSRCYDILSLIDFPIFAVSLLPTQQSSYRIKQIRSMSSRTSSFSERAHGQKLTQSAAEGWKTIGNVQVIECNCLQEPWREGIWMICLEWTDVKVRERQTGTNKQWRSLTWNTWQIAANQDSKKGSFLVKVLPNSTERATIEVLKSAAEVPTCSLTANLRGEMCSSWIWRQRSSGV